MNHIHIAIVIFRPISSYSKLNDPSQRCLKQAENRMNGRQFCYRRLCERSVHDEDQQTLLRLDSEARANPNALMNKTPLMITTSLEISPFPILTAFGSGVLQSLLYYSPSQLPVSSRFRRERKPKHNSHNSTKIQVKSPDFYTCFKQGSQKYRRIFFLILLSCKLACSQNLAKFHVDHRHFCFNTKVPKKTLHSRFGTLISNTIVHWWLRHKLYIFRNAEIFNFYFSQKQL